MPPENVQTRAGHIKLISDAHGETYTREKSIGKQYAQATHPSDPARFAGAMASNCDMDGQHLLSAPFLGL
jgi:hypothetical protein